MVCIVNVSMAIKWELHLGEHLEVFHKMSSGEGSQTEGDGLANRVCCEVFPKKQRLH